MSTDTLTQSSSPSPKKRTAKPKASFASRALRFVLWGVLVLIILVAIVLGLLYFLAGTDSGFKRLSGIASDKVAGLNINEPQGNLRRGISAQSIEFANDTIDIKASELSSGWSLGCLLERKFCLDKVRIETLDVATFALDDAPPAEPRNGPIELPDINLPIDVQITDVSIGTLNFQAPGEAPVQVVNDIALSASTEGSVVTVESLSLGYQAFTARLAGNVETQADYPLKFLLNVTADDALPDTLPEGEGAQPIEVDMALSDSLANLVINTRVSGLAQLEMDATVQPLEQDLPATLTIVSEELGWPVTSKSIIKAQDTRISATGTMDDYTLSVITSLDGEQVPDTDINLDAIVNTKRLSVPSLRIDTLGGQSDASALVSLEQPMLWSTRWNIEDIDPSIQVPDLQGSLNANVNASGMLDDGKWSLKLEKALITGELRELPFRLDAKLTKGLEGLWFIQQVTLNNDLNRVMAQGFVGDELEVNADIALPQLQNFMPGLAGGFNAKISTSGDIKTPNISLQADSEVVRFNDILVQALSINGDISELFSNPSTLDIAVDTVRVGENTVSDTALSLTGERSQHQLTLKADGPLDTDIDLAISGNLDDSLNWIGVFNNLHATVPGHEIDLADPFALQWQNEKKHVSVSPHCWSISGKSNLCLKNQVRTETSGVATITLDDYSLQQLNSFLPGQTKVSGQLGSNIDLSWGDGGPNDRRAVVTTTISKATVQTVDGVGDPVRFGYDTIQLDANVTPDDAVAELALSSTTLGNAEIAVQLNPSEPEGPLTGTVNLQDLQVSVAKAFLPDFDTVEGTISANGKLGGTLALPDYNGDIVLDSPVLKAEILPLPITGGKVTASIAGQSMNLDGQILSDDGVIDIDGRGKIDPEDWYAEVNLRGRQLRIVSEPVQDSTVNHNIKIVVNPRRLSVFGDIDIPEAEIDVAELPAGAATVSSDIVIIEDEEELGTTPLSKNSALDMSVAIDVSLGEKVTLSAYGLNANLTGDIDVRVRGNRPPQLGGEIMVVDGIFKKYGQDLKADGQILFVGPIDGTRLAIDAVRQIENEPGDRTAGLRIQGTVASPEITLFTNPSDKNQDAILSYIILGRDINEASDQEADLMQTAALAIAIKGGQSVGGGVADALGIQEFGLQTRGSGDDAELIVSGRINDRLLLRYGRGVFDPESTLYLRYDLTKKLYLEAAQGAQQAVDLFYSFAF